MQITVIGATGKTGNAVASKALARGHTLRAVSRNADSCLDLSKRGAEIVTCDLDSQYDINSALAGAGAVYYCSPLPVDKDQPFIEERSRGRNVINAARSAGIEHFVLLSAIGPEAAPQAVLIETKRAIERDLAASGLAYTILRPSMFMDNVAMVGPNALRAVGLSWPFSEDALIQPIAAADIAEIAIRAIETGPRNRAFDLVGPEALSFSRMADTLDRAMASELPYTEISDADFIKQVGAAIGSEKVAAAIAAAYRLWEGDGGGTGDPSIPSREFNVSLTRFEDFTSALVEAWNRKGLL